MAHKIAIIVGTRPEGVKLAPVIYLLRKSRLFETVVISTGQHQEMLENVFKVFDIKPDINLAVMRRGQTLNQIASKIIGKLDVVFHEEKPGLVIVQGDTTSAFAGSLASFYARIPVAHVEAGLRTHRSDSPFPEEVNRKLISTVADIHFAPTQMARENLLNEGIPGEKVFVTGNPVVDALKKMEESASTDIKNFVAKVKSHGKRIILVTFHRRESWDKPLKRVCKAISKLTNAFGDICIIFPVHKNPIISETVSKLLGPCPRVYLQEPLSYPDLLYVLKNSALVMTDSGGIQEEAPSYNVPVIILRNETERPEIIGVKLGVLAGTDERKIFEEAKKELSRKNLKYHGSFNPFGDGRASERIKLALERFFSGETPLLGRDEEFTISR